MADNKIFPISYRSIYGTSDRDSLFDDEIYNEFEAAVFYGLEGSDIFVGYSGVDIFVGGEGEKSWYNLINYDTEYRLLNSHLEDPLDPDNTQGVIIFAGGLGVGWNGVYTDLVREDPDPFGVASEFAYGSVVDAGWVSAYDSGFEYAYTADGYAKDVHFNIDAFYDINEFKGTQNNDIFFGIEDTDYVGFWGMGGNDVVLGTKSGWEKLHFFDDLDDQPTTGVVVNASEGLAYREDGVVEFAHVDDFAGTAATDLMIAPQDSEFFGDDHGARLEGRGGDDYLFGGNLWDHVYASGGNDYIDLVDHGEGEGGRVEYRLRLDEGAPSLDRITISNYPDSSGFDVQIDGQVLGSFSFASNNRYDVNSLVNGLNSDLEQGIDAPYSSTLTAVALDTLGPDVVQIDPANIRQIMMEQTGSSYETSLVSTGSLNRENTFETDTIFGANEVQLRVEDANGNELGRIEFVVDYASETVVPISSQYIDQPIFYWTTWDDWRIQGSNDDDVIIYDELKTTGPRPNDLNPDLEWGRVELGDGNDYFDGSGTQNGYEVVSSAGNDTIIGSAEWYENMRFDANSDNAVVIDARAGTLTDEFGDTDTFVDIDSFRMTAGDDLIYAAHSIDAAGMAGNDIFVGSTGYTSVRYDDERWDNPNGTRIEANFGPAPLYIYDAEQDGNPVYTAIVSHTATDSYGDLDSFEAGEFGEYFKNVRGGYLTDDILIGGEDYNHLRGHGGSDYIDGGVGGGSTTYMWSGNQPDGLSAPAGIVANLTNYNIDTGTVGQDGVNSYSFIDRVDNERPNADYSYWLSADTVLDNWGYTDEVHRLNYIEATGFDDIIYTKNLGVSGIWDLAWSEVDPGAGNDLIIGGVNRHDTYTRDELVYNSISYSSAKDFYRWEAERLNETNPGTIPEPTGITIDLTSARMTLSWDNLGDASTDGSFLNALLSQAHLDGNFKSNHATLIEGAEAYFEAYSLDAWAGQSSSESALKADAFLITDPFGDTDLIFNLEAFSGTDYDDTLTGDNFDNALKGRDGDDTLDGGGGSDRLRGQDGNDTLIGGIGHDHMQGGDGDDVIHATGSVMLAADNDMIIGGSGFDTVIFKITDEQAYSIRDGNAQLTDFIKIEAQGTGVYTVERSDGSGTIYETDTVDGINKIVVVNETGDWLGEPTVFDQVQTISGDAAFYLGGNNADEIDASADAKLIDAGGGDDLIYVSGSGRDNPDEPVTVNLGQGADRLVVARDFRGHLVVNSPDDNQENSTLNYDHIDLEGREIIDATFNYSEVEGDKYQDIVVELDGDTTITLNKALILVTDPSTGEPEWYNNNMPDGIRIYPTDYSTDYDFDRPYDELILRDLFASTENMRVWGDLNDTDYLDGEVERLDDGYGGDPVAKGYAIFAAEGDDLIYGTKGGDYIYGGNGNDFLAGHYGSDKIFGGSGDDWLAGDHGADDLRGGTGSDTYIVSMGYSTFLDYEDYGVDGASKVAIKSSSDKILDTSGVEDAIFLDLISWGGDSTKFGGLRNEVSLKDGTLSFTTSLNETAKYVVASDLEDIDDYRQNAVPYFSHTSDNLTNWNTFGFTWEDETDFDLYDVTTYPGFSKLGPTAQNVLAGNSADSVLDAVMDVSTGDLISGELYDAIQALDFLNDNGGTTSSLADVLEIAADYNGATTGFELDGFYESADTIEYIFAAGNDAQNDPNLRLAMQEIEAQLIAKYAEGADPNFDPENKFHPNMNTMFGEELFEALVDNGVLTKYTLSASGIANPTSTDSFMLIANQDRIDEYGVVNAGTGEVEFLFIEVDSNNQQTLSVGLINSEELVEVAYESSGEGYNLSIAAETFESSDMLGRSTVFVRESALKEVGLSIDGTTKVNKISLEQFNNMGRAVLPEAIVHSVGNDDYAPSITVMGGSGDDVIFGSNTVVKDKNGIGDHNVADLIITGKGDDRIEAAGGENLVWAGEGDDKIFIYKEAQSTVIYSDTISINYIDVDLAEADGINLSGSMDEVYLDFDRKDVDLFEISDGQYMVVYDVNGNTSPKPTASASTFTSAEEYLGRANTEDDIVVEIFNAEKLIFNDASISLTQSEAVDLSGYSYSEDEIRFEVSGDMIEVHGTEALSVETSREFLYAEYLVAGAYYGLRHFDPNFDYDASWGIGDYRIVYDIQYEEIEVNKTLWSGDRFGVSSFQFEDDVVKVTNLDKTDINQEAFYALGDAGEIATAAGEIVDVDGHDIIFGTSGNDIINGGGGDDLILGGGGDDLLIGSTGSNILIGGEGRDTLTSGFEAFSGLISDDIMIGGDGVDVIDTEGSLDIAVTDGLDINGDGVFNESDIRYLKDFDALNPLIEKLFDDDTWV